jgi:hypothetical protein
VLTTILCKFPKAKDIGAISFAEVGKMGRKQCRRAL